MCYSCYFTFHKPSFPLSVPTFTIAGGVFAKMGSKASDGVHSIHELHERNGSDLDHEDQKAATTKGGTANGQTNQQPAMHAVLTRQQMLEICTEWDERRSCA